MKKIASFALALFMTAAAVFSFQLAHSQSEPVKDASVLAENCVCKTPNGVEHVYSIVTACRSGGDQDCVDVDCPAPPPGCN